MANLEEQTTYDEGVYQIETDDVVIGGPEGITNKSSKNLGNRTAWIKKQIDNTILAANMTVDDTKLNGLAEAVASIAGENSSSLSSALDSNSTEIGATSKAVKLVNDALVLLAQAVDNKSSADHSHQLPFASTSQRGISQLNNSLNSESEVTAATSKAIKAVNDALQSVIIDVVKLNTMLIGAPIPWPSSVVPSGCLQYRGQAFDPIAFPMLAILYPNHILLDLRGEFIRGWDDGRGVDNGRSLVSSQGDAIRNITGNISVGAEYGGSSGVFTHSSYGSRNTGHDTSGKRFYFDASRVVPTASENRPRNVAFMYITRAA